MTQSPASPSSEDAPGPPDEVRGDLTVALRYLLSGGASGLVGRVAPGVLRRSVIWFVPIGLLIGLAWVGVFRVSWRVFGQETAALRAIPALTILLLECLLTGRLLLWAAVSVTSPNSDARGRGSGPSGDTGLSFCGGAVLLLLLLGQWILIAGIPDLQSWWPAQADWRHAFNFLYPKSIFRPLLLAPLWGRWAVLLAATVGRAAPGADPHTIALTEAMSPSRLLRQSLLPLLLTIVFFSRVHNRFVGLIMALIVFAVTFLAAVVMAQRRGGQDRTTVLATAQTAQVSFLLVYRGFWPFMQ